MMNCKITSAITRTSFRRSSYQTLSLHRNFSKISASQINTFRYNINNQSPCIPLSLRISRKGLLHVAASSNLQSQRNFSNILQDIQKFFQPEKEDATPAVESATNAVETEQIPFSLSNFVDEINNTWFIKYLQQYILDFHVECGLPWWGTIAVIAVMFRTSTILPAAISQIVFMTRMRKVEVDVQSAVPALRLQIAEDRKKLGWSDVLAKKKLDFAISRKYNGLVYNNHCHPMKGLILPVIQVPLWLTLTLCIRDFCILNSTDVSNEIYSELSTEGFMWITNLTAADPYMILPITLGLVNLATIEIHQLFKVDTKTKRERYMVLFFRTLSLGIVPVAAYMPAAVNIYWLTSSLYGFMQAFILHSAFVRSACKLPVPEPEQKYPYRLFKHNVQLKLGMKTSKGTVQWFTCNFNERTSQLIFMLKNNFS